VVYLRLDAIMVGWWCLMVTYGHVCGSLCWVRPWRPRFTIRIHGLMMDLIGSGSTYAFTLSWPRCNDCLDTAGIGLLNFSGRQW